MCEKWTTRAVQGDRIRRSGGEEVMEVARSVKFPSLHYRKEGWLRHQTDVAKPPKATQPGWFSICDYRKTTPSSRLADASRYFLDRSATPPCSDARRGIALP